MMRHVSRDKLLHSRVEGVRQATSMELDAALRKPRRVTKPVDAVGDGGGCDELPQYHELLVGQDGRRLFPVKPGIFLAVTKATWETLRNTSSLNQILRDLKDDVDEHGLVTVQQGRGA